MGEARGLAAEQRVAGATPRDGDGAGFEPGERLREPLDQSVDDRLLDRGRDVAEPRVGNRVGLTLEEELSRGLETAHAQVERVPLEPGFGERNLIRPPLPGEPVEVRPRRVRQAEKLPDLIEGLSDGVVTRRTDAPKDPLLRHMIDLCMAPGGDHAHIGGIELGFEPRGDEVRLHVVHPHPGDATRHGESFGELDAHEERALKPRPDRNGDGIDLAGLGSRGPEGLVDDAGQERDVGPRRQLRDDPAVLEMDVLGRDDVGENAAVFDDGRAGVIA